MYNIRLMKCRWRRLFQFFFSFLFCEIVIFLCNVKGDCENEYHTGFNYVRMIGNSKVWCDCIFDETRQLLYKMLAGISEITHINLYSFLVQEVKKLPFTSLFYQSIFKLPKTHTFSSKQFFATVLLLTTPYSG